MTGAIVTALSKADPAHAALYAANGGRQTQNLRALEHDLTIALTPLRGRPYLVFHDAYQYSNGASRSNP